MAITGAAGGVGAAFVRRFLDNGDVVIATDTAEDSLAKRAWSMNSDRLHTCTADIIDEVDTKAAAGLACETTERVNVQTEGDDPWLTIPSPQADIPVPFPPTT